MRLHSLAPVLAAGALLFTLGGESTTDLDHYRTAALDELRRLAANADPERAGPLDVALDDAIRAAKGLPPRPEGVEPYVRLFAAPPRPLSLTALTLLVGDAKAAAWLEPLNAALDRFGITHPLEVAHFLAQCLHETGGLRWLSELWGPTAAQQRYEGRRDLGNTQPGDGYRYRGRGCIHLTGRHNYRRAGEALGLPLEEQPDLAAEPGPAALIAAWYWHQRGIGEPARRDDLVAVTRAVNGGTNGLTDRASWLRRAKTALGVPL